MSKSLKVFNLVIVYFFSITIIENIMLYQIGIQPLTRKQILNLSKGKGVRVKAGEFIVDVDKKQYNAYNRNSRQGKAFTFKLARHHGSGFLQDAYNFIKSRPVLKRAVNYGIQTGKRYAHRGVDYLSGKAHQAVERLPMIGDGMRPRRRGRGVGGLVLQGAAGLSNLIGGPGSGEAADVLRGASGVANFFGLGLKKKATQKQLANLQKARAVRALNLQKGRGKTGRALLPAGY
jgi:hypothetical protein